MKAVCDILEQAIEGSKSKYLIVDYESKPPNEPSVESSVGSTDIPAEASIPNGEVPDETKDDIHLVESSILLRQNISSEEFHTCLR